MAKKYSKTKLKVFKDSIEKRMEEIANDMDDLHEGILDNGSSGGGLSQESVYSVHMADAGTDSFEQEKNYNLMSRESDYYKNLEIALERIDDGTFGMCNICEDLIPEERMMEVPNATKCVKCKEKDKLGLI
ncbi:MAG: conjugal transfer protein TraR [Candidatus Marinimicrobia bacterium]|jgi:DnaK suppressor protein|nr:conjugal transfer protein TraR [Candidatus Neomarinimicrobiota bacterium]|tara:strand:+ start:96 stop:488 length:393 start_codon:yes stop_codon:yes gene_type:complete